MTARRSRSQPDDRIRIRSVRKGQPDLRKLARAVIALAQAKAEAEAEAEAKAKQQTNGSGDGAMNGGTP